MTEIEKFLINEIIELRVLLAKADVGSGNCPYATCMLDSGLFIEGESVSCDDCDKCKKNFYNRYAELVKQQLLSDIEKIRNKENVT